MNESNANSIHLTNTETHCSIQQRKIQEWKQKPKAWKMHS